MKIEKDEASILVMFCASLGGEPVTERMYAIRQNDGNYILDNSPFYAYEISWGDKFSAQFIDGALAFQSIIERSGHSTYRIRLPVGRNHDYFELNFVKLALLGCTYEGSSGSPARLYSVDIPPNIDIAACYAELEAGEKSGIWSFEEAHYFVR